MPCECYDNITFFRWPGAPPPPMRCRPRQSFGTIKWNVFSAELNFEEKYCTFVTWHTELLHTLVSVLRTVKAKNIMINTSRTKLIFNGCH